MCKNSIYRNNFEESCKFLLDKSIISTINGRFFADSGAFAENSLFNKIK
jgi:hypothetical protein